MRLTLGGLLLLLAALSIHHQPARAQVSAPQIQYTTANPTGAACGATNLRLRTPNGILYSCQSGVFAAIGGGSGMGCVPVGSAGEILVDDGGGECTSTAVTISGTTVTGNLNGGLISGLLLFSGPASTAKTWTGPNANATLLTSAAAVTVAQGGTGLASGTSGGVPCYTGTTTITSSGALTANLPVFGGGAGVCPIVGTRSGNTTVVVTTTGTQTNGRCVEIDASGNHIAAAAGCGTGGSGCVPAGSAGGILIDDGLGACDTSEVTIDTTAGRAGGFGMPAGTAPDPAANSIVIYAPTSVSTAYGVVLPGAVGTSGIVHNTTAGAVSTWSFALVASADLNITTSTCTNQFLTAISATATGTCTTNTLAGAQHANQGTTTTVLHGNGAGNPSWAGVVAADVSTSLKTASCQPGLGDGLNALPAATYLESTCYNDTGATLTITGLKCFTDNGGSSTLAATNGAGTALLTGAITCSSSFAAGTQSGTTTIASGDYVKFTFVADGTSKQSTWALTFNK